MKQALLFIFFLSFSTVVFSQSSFSDRLSIKRVSNKPSIKIFPNPVTTSLGISDNKLVSKIVVFNLVGRKMKTFTYEKGERYSVSELPKGMYLVQLLGFKNDIILTQRITKK